MCSRRDPASSNSVLTLRIACSAWAAGSLAVEVVVEVEAGLAAQEHVPAGADRHADIVVQRLRAIHVPRVEAADALVDHGGTPLARADGITCHRHAQAPPERDGQGAR